ncbi:Protein kinase protein with adenine nucleotide alpha hydrolases-like domain [Striga hermonthica]|uniref:Protein kinase protein with adenine nucleotide alpha hydrolases-like domain n=1 Tax=Striga hermonthica TaxID=68872 RepID=A0A9N7NFF0_STRHE|nr:Protein kinase protein with adenine nucleotide alpha hydrolases-like domain [Striga hermonthica]
MNAAGPGDCILAINVCRNSGCFSAERALLDSCLEEYRGLCKDKQVALSGQVLKGNSIKKVLVREAKNCSASLVIVGITKLSAFGGWTSVAKYCSKKLPKTTEVISIYDGKVFFSRLSNLQLLQEPVSSLTEKVNFTNARSKFGESKMSSFDEKARFGVSDPKPGWPLLQTAGSKARPP